MPPPAPVRTVPPPESSWARLDPRRSLPARAAAGVGAGAIAFLLLAGWIAGTILRRQLEAQVGPGLEAAAFQVGDKLDRHLAERLRELQFAATTLPSLRRPDARPAEQRRELELLRDVSPDVAWAGLADPAGRVVAATDGRWEDTSAAERTWFRAGVDHAYLSDPHEQVDLARVTPTREDTLARFLDLAVPVIGPEGRIAGVLAAQLRWSWARAIERSVLGEAAARARIGATVYAAGGDVLLDSGASGWTNPPDPPALAAGNRRRGWFVEPTPGGTTYVTGYARSAGAGEFRGAGWLAVVRQPLDEVLAPERELRRLLTIAGIALTLAAVTATWLFASRIARRLRSVTAAAQRIRAGDVLTVLPGRHGDGELDRMCGALGELVEDLRAQAPPEPPVALPDERRPY